MANRAYMSLWFPDFDERQLLHLFRDFLQTIPFSAALPGLEYLVIRAVGPEETPVFEKDLRGWPCTPPEVVELASEFLHSDCAYETSAHWDLWKIHSDTFEWQETPERLSVICQGKDYDGNSASDFGHIQADVGFEHLFTGHAGMLRRNWNPSAPPEHPAESKFLAWMSHPEHRRLYVEKTRENIRRLNAWVERVAKALPLERYSLWSEGEENFEACLEEILVAR